MGKKSTFHPYRVKKHHSTLKIGTFKLMLLLSYLALLDDKPHKSQDSLEYVYFDFKASKTGKDQYIINNRQRRKKNNTGPEICFKK